MIVFQDKQVPSRPNTRVEINDSDVRRFAGNFSSISRMKRVAKQLRASNLPVPARCEERINFRRQYILSMTEQVQLNDVRRRQTSPGT